MLKKFISLFTALCLGAALLTGCAASATEPPDDGRLRVVATLFPQYDFARRIAGGKADVTLLLPPGVESHSYEPAPADMIAINRADLFLYTGEHMEPWARGIIGGMTGSTRVVDLSAHVALDEEGHGGEPDGHDHGGFDPHIWTSPVNAKIMAEDVTGALSQADPDNAAYYAANMALYGTELDALDKTLAEVVSTAARKEIVFGGRFALHYFAERYGLTYRAAFDSCSSETEPSVRVVAQIIDEVRAQGIPVIFHEELTDPKVARLIAEETGAKLLLLHSCHNVSKDELKNGATYLSLMEQNARNLKEGLN